jgi:transposase
LSCKEVAKILFVDDDTIRSWRQLYEEDGLEGLTRFEAGGSACQLSGEQQEALKSMGRGDLAADDARSRRMGREGIRRPLREPLGSRQMAFFTGLQARSEFPP